MYLAVARAVKKRALPFDRSEGLWLTFAHMVQKSRQPSAGPRRTGMDTTEKKGTGAGKGRAGNGADLGLETAGSLDKVREILFGAQAHEFEKRLARLDERISKELASFRDDTRKRLDSLEHYL